MRFITLIAASLLATVAGDAIAQRTRPTAFVDVRVETMTDQGPIDRGYVIVEDGRIASVKAGVLPKDFDGIRINGRGRTLMPGLADMHVHYNERGMGISFIANGITVVRNLTGSLDVAMLDQAARDGTLIGPRADTSGPIINAGFFVKADNPDQAIGAVRSQAKSGFRAVKLYNDLTAESFRAAVTEARTNNMRVYCHVPFSMSVYDVLDLKVDSIEHLTGYGLEIARDGFKPSGEPAWDELWANADPGKFAALARRTATAGTYMVPTLALEYGAIASERPDAYFARPEATYLSPTLVKRFYSVDRYRSAGRPYVVRGLQAKIAFLSALRKAGANILIGTDTPNPFVTPGYAIHDEIQGFAQAGYTNREILRIATVDAARFMGEDGTAGIVATGARADLILLPRDPVQDLSALKQPAGVMVSGHWYDRAAIDKALAKQAAMVRAERARVPK